MSNPICMQCYTQSKSCFASKYLLIGMKNTEHEKQIIK